MRRNLAIAAACVASMTVVGTASAQFSLTANTAFGGGDGWRAPLEVLTGDLAGTAGASGYNYLATANLERGMAYNPVTGNLVLVSRSTAGNGIRVLSGSTGADVGFLPQGTGVISGGVFAINMVGVAEDGAIYVGNLATDATPTGFRTYRWENEAATAPTVYSTFTAPNQFGTPRMGDSMDVIGSGANTRIVASGSNVLSYGVFRGDGSYQLVNSWGGITAPTNSFRLGITFAETPNDVWGKSPGTQTTVGFSVSTYNESGGVFISDSLELGSQGVAPMDYVKIGSNAYLAALDINSSVVRVYDVNNPLTPVLLATGPAPLPQASLAPNGNGTGSIKWGAIDPNTGSASIYSMSTNQGLTALTFTFPGAAPSFVLGDFNFDGGVDASDIDPFVVAANEGDPFAGYIAASQAAFELLYPGQTLTPTIVNQIGDFNGDGGVDASDIDPFVVFANNGGSGIAAIPEPAALGLLAPLGLLMARRRRA